MILPRHPAAWWALLLAHPLLPLGDLLGLLGCGRAAAWIFWLHDHLSGGLA